MRNLHSFAMFQLFSLKLTVHFDLHHFADASANAIVCLAQIEALSVLLDILQEQ
jgi:hypothetical protein